MFNLVNVSRSAVKKHTQTHTTNTHLYTFIKERFNK